MLIQSIQKYRQLPYTADQSQQKAPDFCIVTFFSQISRFGGSKNIVCDL